MSAEKQPIPGPDQTKSERRFEETGSADDPRKRHERSPASEDGTIPPGTRPPPD